MAWHHHLKTVHSHARRAGRSFLVKSAEHHPIVVTALAILGGAAIFSKMSSKSKSGVVGAGGQV